MIRFERPLLLLALLLLALAVAVYVLAQRRRMRYALTFTNVAVLAGVLAERHAWRRYVPPALVLLSLAALLVALARPHVERTTLVDGATVILVIDASRSMESQDVRPSRLAAAKTAAKRFLERVPDRVRVGLVVFSGDVQVGAPPTSDHALVARSVDAIGDFSGFGGTAIGDAIARAVELGRRSVQEPGRPRSARGLVSILFLSDGRQNRGILPPMVGAARAAAASIPVYTVALGTRNPGGGGGGFGFFGRRNRVPDPATLRAIARTTKGEFFEAKTAGAVEQAYEDLGGRLGRGPGLSEVTFAFVLGAAAALVAAGVLSALWSPRIP